MPYRNVLSLIRRIAIANLGVIALVLPAPTLADSSDSFPSLAVLNALQENEIERSDVDTLTVHELPVAPQPASTIDLTAQPDDLWVRIRNGFAMTNLNDDLTLHYQQYFQNRPEALRRMVERSRPFLHHIVQELEARGMPTELALLPMVESSFNPMAYSRAHASGLWQFIPATGKRFNLEQNWWRDERRDIVASTGAALDYLQTIYEMQGDWHLALASYNWGEGAVKRAVEKNELRGLATDYPSLNMPNETRHYVPKLQALKNILGNPVLALQLGIPRIPNEPYFATLETPRPIDVKTAAQLANMSLDEFQRLNPSHNRPVIKSDTPVVIPADKLEAFRSNLENHRAPLSQWQAYTLTAAERLDQIAVRFDTTAAELARVNGLSQKARLGAGSTLLVPGNGNVFSLNHLLNTTAPQQIIEPEPVVRHCGKGGKHGKRPVRACRQESPQPVARAGKHGGKVIDKPTGKLTAKSREQSTKSLANAKVRAKASGPAPGKAKVTSISSKPPAKASAKGRHH